jgi:hypothetical protein
MTVLFRTKVVGKVQRNNECFSGRYAVAFGLGLVISCFCPTGLMLFIVAVIIVGLGIALLKC